MILRFACLRIEQRSDVPLYVFGVNGRVIHQFASVDPAKRSADGVLAGYQRDRVEGHIRQIRGYLAQEDALLPNAVVVAFGEEVKFEPSAGSIKSRWGTPGTLLVPLPGPREQKPGFIVDGQQRVSALAELPPERQFPVVVVSFASPSADLQREQFMLVNKTKPLPRDLLNELLPYVRGSVLPTIWRSRQRGMEVVELLRLDRRSPFYGRIRGLGGTGEGFNISQAAVLSVIDGSIRRSGVLSTQAPSDSKMAGVEVTAEIVSVFFQGVARVWPLAWASSPWTSRLVHGVGISSLGRLMDVVMDEVDASRPRAVSSVERRIRRIENRCAWTSGRWPGPLDCAWDQLQNTGQDKRRLGEYLIGEYSRLS